MIRKATAVDSRVLTNISFASKGYWDYPAEYFTVWTKELTITPEYIERNEVYVYEEHSLIAGYYSLVELPDDIIVAGVRLEKGSWLEHMFISPQRIGKGFGSKLFTHLHQLCKDKNLHELKILADPHAKGFYEKMGCQYVGEYPSTIEKRTTPYLILLP